MLSEKAPGAMPAGVAPTGMSRFAKEKGKDRAALPLAFSRCGSDCWLRVAYAPHLAVSAAATALPSSKHFA